MDNDPDIARYIAEYNASAAACRICRPGHTCLSHTCLDCGANHAPAAPCPIDMFGS